MLIAVKENTGMIPLLFYMLIAVKENTGMIPLLFCMLIAVNENIGIMQREEQCVRIPTLCKERSYPFLLLFP